VDKAKELISRASNGASSTASRSSWARQEDRLARAYKQATEKYASPGEARRDGLSLQNYVAGEPFPNLDPKESAVRPSR